MFKMYGDIIKDQDKRGFIEKVNQTNDANNRVHYFPHHPVNKGFIDHSNYNNLQLFTNGSNKSPSINGCLADYLPMINELT